MPTNINSERYHGAENAVKESAAPADWCSEAKVRVKVNAWSQLVVF